MHIPLATYRLQLSPSFRFQDAAALIPYLCQLGISDIYASPILKATPGSSHGYDVTDPNQLNPDLGSSREFQVLAGEVHAHGMGWLQDVVPNHMAYSSENRMLMDVLESDVHSRFFDFFDIFRDHPDAELRTRVLAPFLGSPLEACLRQGEVRLVLDRDGLGIRYHDWRFPLSLRSYGTVLRWHFEQADRLSGNSQSLGSLAGICGDFAELSETEDSPERRRQLADTKEVLWELYNHNQPIRSHLNEALDSFNHVPEGPLASSPLYALLEQQHFRLEFWRTAYQKINYRRFFYLSDFIAVRIEKPEVFRLTQSKIIEWVKSSIFTGLRIDHLDGLYDPRSYLAHLRETLPDAYVVVEKILELDEALPAGWPIQGTSGYKFCNCVNSVLCRQENEHAITQVYHDFIGSELDYGRLLYTEKKKILEQRMAGEVAYLAHLSIRACPGESHYDIQSVKKALSAVMVAFPIYRTYADVNHFTGQDRVFLATAIAEARRNAPECADDIDRIGRILLSDTPTDSDDASRRAWRHFLMRFQQFTGPAMAKGFEDTVLYVYNRFVSLNEVGGSPNEFGLSLRRFHRFNEMRAQNWPLAMNATSTHDSKRGEDIRARLNVLSEIPERWRRAVTHWARLNEVHRQPCAGGLAPDSNDEYMLYQTLIGAMPFDPAEYQNFPRRVQEYMTKAVREAKVHGSWVEPNEEYETGCLHFVERILDRPSSPAFWDDFLPFQREVSEYGVYNSLSQAALKMTCPGLPDFYQGAELWDLSLVDPDNRRPVDFEKRRQLLQQIQVATSDEDCRFLQEMMDFKEDGRIKLFLIWKGLQARRANRDLFEGGQYIPATVKGTRADHAVAFCRVHRGHCALTVVPRFLTSIIRPGESLTQRQVWEDTRILLPPKSPFRWHNAITGCDLSTSGELFVGDALATFPVAILLSQT